MQSKTTPTVLLEDLLSGRRLVGGDWKPALMCARVAVREADARAMRVALDADAGRGVFSALLHGAMAPSWPLRAVAALARGLGTREGETAAWRLEAEADARGEAPLGARAQRHADGMARAAEGRRAAIAAAAVAQLERAAAEIASPRGQAYDAAFDAFHAETGGRVVSLDARRTQVRRPSSVER